MKASRTPTEIGTRVQPLLDMAWTFLRTAREEMDEGFAANNYVKVRDGAEKAWNAILQATDHAMRVHGRTPLPGRDAHRDRREFLESIGRGDLAREFTYSAERLHGDVFYVGAQVSPDAARRYMDEVEDYIRKVSDL